MTERRRVPSHTLDSVHTENGEDALDALLAAWRRDTLPARFPPLPPWVAGAAAPGRAYWRVMRRIWAGEPWRRCMERCWMPRVLAVVRSAPLHGG